MRTVPRQPSEFPKKRYICGSCNMKYENYNDLVTHLFWRHGTESTKCPKCLISRWRYAAHMCNVLPIAELVFQEDDDTSNDVNEKREYEFCYCGQNVVDAPMIGCDGPNCRLQWYHFGCVGVVEPPDGHWLCPSCSK